MYKYKSVERAARKRYREKNAEVIRQKRREDYVDNRERRLEYVKRYYLEHREEKVRYAKIYRRKNAAAIRAKDKTRYFERYGISKSQFEELSRKQKFCCALCLQKRRLFVDHDHEYPRRSPSAVRGLLCGGCNVALGNLGDSVAGLRRAIAYLQRVRPFQTHKKEPV